MYAPLRVLSVLVLTLGMAASALALNPGERVDNFRLLDQNGASHELYYLSDAKAVVLMVHGNGCPIVRNTAADTEGDPRPVSQSGRGIPADQFQPAGRPRCHRQGSSRVRHRFPDPGGRDAADRRIAGRHPHGRRLRDRPEELEARLSRPDGRPACLRRADAPPPGSTISRTHSMRCWPESRSRSRRPRRWAAWSNFPERDRRDAHAQISYSGRIAPLLADRCASCHRAGGVAPWAMTSYDKVRGFAPMIREVVRTKRMPPWHADPHYGSFVGDRSLSDRRRENAGALDRGRRTARHGAGPARRAGPDLVRVDAGQARSDRGGARVRGAGDRGGQLPVSASRAIRWAAMSGLRAIEILPGDRSVVHHVLAGIDDPRQRRSARDPRPDRRAGRLRAGQERGPLPRGHRHPAAQGSELPLPDALHAQRQGDHRRDPGRLLLLRQAAEASAAK